MAKPNYQFEKRQRDLAKRQKQEDKRQQKLANKAVGADALQGNAPVDQDAHDPQGLVLGSRG